MRSWAEHGAAALDRLITEQRVRNYSAILLAIWVATLLGSVIRGQPPRNALDNPILPDYLAHWIGGRMLLEGAGPNLYDLQRQLLLQHWAVGEHDLMAWFINPPFMAFFYLPLAALPYAPSALVWTSFSILLLIVSAWLMRPLVPRIAERWGLVLLAAAAAPPFYELIGSGQDSAISVFLWVAGTRLALARRDTLAGALFALGLFKPQLFFLPPLLFLCWWRVRALLGWGLTAGGLGYVSLLLVGPDGIGSWLGQLVSPLYREAVQAGQAWKMQTIPALLTAAAPRQLATQAEALGLLLGLVLVDALVREASRPARPGSSQGSYLVPALSFGRGAWGGDNEARLWGLACLTTLLASPHLALYDLVLLIPPALLLLEHHNERSVRLALLAVFILTWTLPVRHLLFSSMPWPISALGASWSAVPLLALWMALARVSRGVSEAAQPVSGDPSRTGLARASLQQA